MKFVLRQERAAKFDRTTIYAQYSYKGLAKRYATPYQIRPDTWAADKETVTSKEPRAREINAGLKAYRARFDSFLLDAKLRGLEPSHTYMAAMLAPPDTSQTDVPTLIEHWARFMAYRRADGRTAEMTLRCFEVAFRHLSEWSQGQRQAMTWETLTAPLVSELVAYLRGRHLAEGSIGQTIRLLKIFARWANVRGLNPNEHFKNWQAPRPDRQHRAALSASDMEALERIDLTGVLAEVRDFFLFLCETGLRQSDMYQAKGSAIVRGLPTDKILVTTTKTKDPLAIPLSPRASAILRRYPDGFKPRASPVINLKIKEVARLAGLTDAFTVVSYRNGQRMEVAKPLHECISTHTGRRTFITMALQAGIPAHLIMKITGHKDIKTLMGYEQTTAIQAHNAMAEMWRKQG